MLALRAFAVAVVLGSLATRSTQAQIRGLPVLLEPAEPVTKPWRLGLDLAFGGEARAFTTAVRGTRLLQKGPCARFGLSGGVGLHNPPGSSASTHVTAGVGARFMLGRTASGPTAVCPSPWSIVAGSEVTELADEMQGTLLLGFGKAHRFNIAVAGVEVWAISHVVWTGIGATGSSDVKLGATAGFQMSSGAFLGGGGVRVAATIRGDQLSVSFGPTVRF